MLCGKTCDRHHHCHIIIITTTTTIADVTIIHLLQSCLKGCSEIMYKIFDHEHQRERKLGTHARLKQFCVGKVVFRGFDSQFFHIIP
jgi:hypothetical protein